MIYIVLTISVVVLLIIINNLYQHLLEVERLVVEHTSNIYGGIEDIHKELNKKTNRRIPKKK